MQPTLYMLVGVPGSGKSTWVTEALDDSVSYISSDYYVEKLAKKMGKTYNDVFADVISYATKLMMQDVESAKQENKDIVWDQTNVSAKARARKLRALGSYRAVAVVFKTPPEDVLDARIAARPGKIIPKHVMQSMISSLQYPSKEEGFDEIWDIDQY